MYERILEIACYGGHIEIVKMNLNKETKLLNNGLEYACEGGHIEIAKLIIKTGVERNIRLDFNHALERACMGRHIDCVKLMISSGADEKFCAECIESLDIDYSEYEDNNCINIIYLLINHNVGRALDRYPKCKTQYYIYLACKNKIKTMMDIDNVYLLNLNDDISSKICNILHLFVNFRER